MGNDNPFIAEVLGSGILFNIDLALLDGAPNILTNVVIARWLSQFNYNLSESLQNTNNEM